jgi:hypothetical protein
MMDADEHARRVHDRLEQGSDEILKGERWGELPRLSADELAVRHDACLAKATDELSGDMKILLLARAQTYSAERIRREEVRQGERMETLTRSLNKLTRWIVALTVLIAIATIIGVALTAWTLLSGA